MIQTKDFEDSTSKLGDSSQISSLLDGCRFGTKLPKKSGDKHRRRTHGEQIGAGRARERTVSAVAYFRPIGKAESADCIIPGEERL